MRRLQKIIQVLLPLAFGIGIVWFILKKVDMQLLFDTIKSGINWTWVIISWFFALLANVVRGIRWRQQLRTVGVDPSLHMMSISFFGNYGMNLVFPRLGEFWRCNYIAQNNRKPFSTIAGTILSERLTDILCSASIILLCLVLEGKVLLKFFFDDDSKAEAIAAAGGEIRAESTSVVPGWLWVLVILVILLLLFWIFRPKLKRMSFYQSFVSVGQNMWKGFLSLKDLPNIWSYIGWSVLIWFFYFVLLFLEHADTILLLRFHQSSRPSCLPICFCHGHDVPIAAHPGRTGSMAGNGDFRTAPIWNRQSTRDNICRCGMDNRTGVCSPDGSLCFHRCST